jgi:ribosomal protein S12 methylthiotransferase
MGRTGTREKYLDVINKIKQELPNAILRTTLIVGFPGETHKDHLDLIDFVKTVKFDHLGVFAFSDEEDTPSNKMQNKVSKKIANQRVKEIMKLQQQISLQLNQNRINEIHDVLIEDFDGNNYYGRSYLYAPDAEDGYFIIKSKKNLIIGEYVKVKINAVTAYDVLGEL